MYRYAYGLLGVVLLSSQASAQYGVNWPKQPDNPLATGVQPGKQVLLISGVNDFLYKYQINVVETETQFSPTIPAGAGVSCEVPDNDFTTSHKTHHLPSVDKLTDDFNNVWHAYQNLFPDTAAPAKSLAETQQQWKDKVANIYDNLQDEIDAANKAVSDLRDDEPGPDKPKPKRNCQQVVDSISKTYREVLQPAKKQIIEGDHTVEATFQAKSCKTETFTVTEKYKGTPTGQSIVVRLDADCDQVTASGGIILSEIQNRTYTSVPAPNQTGQFLAVGGTGKLRPAFVALTNFNLPVERWHKGTSDWTAPIGDVRFGLSIGPVIQSSKSDVSSFGWFFGGTVSFLRRLYVSPGVHVGEFADFPLGFVANQQIPPNFGTLTPVKRWTSRFAIAFTIKGWDISKAVKGGSDVPAPTVKKK